MTRRILFTLVVWACALVPGAWAEEAGSGHYVPGATASFIDTLPDRQALAYLNAFTYYNGSAGGGRTLEFGGEHHR